MSEVTAYMPRVTCMSYCYGGSVELEVDEYPDDYCVVKYADHVAAVAEAERGRSEWAQTNWDQGYAAGQRDTVQGHPIESCTSSYEQGQRDAIAKAIAAVDARLEELRWVAIPKGESRVDAVKREVIAALKAVS